jgi:UDP-N-acetyl-D-galactosamine dehydrogenase
MSEYVVGRLLALLARHRINVAGARILVLGITFKEDCPDLRNTRVVEIVQELRALNAVVSVCDPWADGAECRSHYEIDLVPEPREGAYDAVLVAVAHEQFRAMGADGVRRLLRPGGVVFDVKYVLAPDAADDRL